MLKPISKKIMMEISSHRALCLSNDEVYIFVEKSTENNKLKFIMGRPASICDDRILLDIAIMFKDYTIDIDFTKISQIYLIKYDAFKDLDNLELYCEQVYQDEPLSVDAENAMLKIIKNKFKENRYIPWEYTTIGWN